MKTFTAIALVFLLCLIGLNNLQAQITVTNYRLGSPLTKTELAKQKYNEPSFTPTGSRAITDAYILDYDGFDQYVGTFSGSNYARYSWLLNKRWPSNEASTFGWVAGLYDTLILNDIANGGYSMVPNGSATYKLDSVLVYFVHEHVTFGTDSIRLRIFDRANVSATAANGIQGTLLWDTLIQTTVALSPPNPTNYSSYIFHPKLNFAAGKSFVAELTYSGDTANHFSYMGGYRNDCSGTCAGSPSYAGVHTLMKFNTSNQGALVAYPQNIFYDCDNDQTGVPTPGGCEEFYVQNLGIFPYITATINNGVSIESDSTNLRGCPGAEFTLYAVPYGSSGPYSYQWSASNGIISSPTFGSTTFRLGNTNAVVSVTVTDGSNNTASASINIQSSGINVNITNSPKPVILSCNSSVILTTQISGTTTGSIYKWSTGATGPSVSSLQVTTPATYIVTVTNNAGCSVSASVTVQYPNITNTVSFLPPSDVSPNQGIQVCSAGQPISFTNTSQKTNGWNFTWAYGNGNQSFNVNGVNTYANAGTYSVVLTADSAGCEFVSQTTVINVLPAGNLACNSTSACTTNPNITSGWLPQAADVACIQQGVSFSETYTFVVPASITYNGVPLTIDSFLLNSVTNLPAGLTWSPGRSPAKYYPGEKGCFTVSGTTNAACGQYVERIIGTLYVNFFIDSIKADLAVLAAQPGIQGLQGFNRQYLRVINSVGTCPAIIDDTTSFIPNVNCTGIPALNASINGTNVNCFGQNTGSATVTATGGTNYSYIWNTGSTLTTINSLIAGTYSVTVTSNGQTASASVNITQPSSQLTASASATNTNCGVSNGTATVTANGGTPNYTYSWSGGGNTSTVNNLAVGAYTVTVADSKNCTATASANVTTQATFILSTSSTEALCFGQNSGTATVTVTGATSNVNYSWSNGGNTATVTNLVPGVYSVTVTDASACAKTSTVTVGQPTPITPNVSTTQSTCGGTTGTASVTATGGTPNYTYNWSNGGNTASINGLAAGSYTVTVRDDNQCAATATAAVTAPANTTLNINATNVGCYGQSTGSVTVSASGGTTPYTYNWNTGSNTATISNVAAGTYNVTVTDAAGCSKTGSGTVTQPATAFTANATSTNSSCGSTTGSVSVTVSGNNGAPTYLWSVNNATSTTVNNLGVGVYTVTATAGGCTATATTSVNNLNGPTVQLLKTDPTCFNSNNGLITAVVSGGQQPYSYVWSTGDNTVTVNNLDAGTYTLIVSDVTNCQATSFVTLIEPTAITLNPAVTNVACNGTSTGSIHLNVSGGTSPYAYNWSSSNSTSFVENITPGSYTVTVSDAQSCSVTSAITVNEPTIITCTTQSTASTGSNGTATAQPGGGVPPYSYIWSTSQTTATISGLAPGTVTVTITDSKGCTATSTASVLISDINEATTALVNLQVFPNPAGDIINISSEVENIQAQICLIDVTGKTVYATVANFSSLFKHQINVTGFNTGIYTLSVTVNGQWAHKKIIINH